MKLLLLVQSPGDVAHLNSAARSIVASSITGVWVVFSPAVLINATDAAAKLDSEIEQLRAAERQAADRSDYAAASGYKTQREGKELDRAKVLRDAWKTISDEDRKTRTEMIFEPFKKTLLDGKKGINLRVTAHSDHYEREQWVAMLNSLSGVWFKPFTPGSFVIGWPEAVETSVAVKNALMPTIETAKFQEKVDAVVSTWEGREKELNDMHRHELQGVARKLNLNAGKKTPELIADILAAERKPAEEPALAEY